MEKQLDFIVQILTLVRNYSKGEGMFPQGSRHSSQIYETLIDQLNTSSNGNLKSKLRTALKYVTAGEELSIKMAEVVKLVQQKVVCLLDSMLVVLDKVEGMNRQK